MSLALLQTALFLPAELLLNQLLVLDAASPSRLSALEGRTLALRVTRPEFEFFISIRNGKLRLSPVFEGETDASLRGAATDLLRVLTQPTPVSNLAPFNVELQGSTAFVQALQELLKDLDVDWEFHLSRLIGDLPVAGLSKGLQAGRSFVSNTSKTALDNVQEYLAYESNLLLSRAAAERFYQNLTELTLRADRLEARINALRNSGTEPT